MGLEPRHARVDDLDPAGVQGPQRGTGRCELVVQRRALPGDEDAAGGDERQAHLHELGERRDRARRDRGPRLAVTGVVGEGLGTDRLRGDRPRPTGGLDDRAQEPDLLGDRIDEQRAVRGERDGERDAREAAAAAEVQQPGDAARPERRDRRQAVDDVGEGDRGRLADRRQVDRLGPGEEQADVVVDGACGRRCRAPGRGRARPSARASPYADGSSGRSETRVGSGRLGWSRAPS